MHLKLLPLALALHAVLLAEPSSPRPTTEIKGKSYPVYTESDGIKPLSTAPTGYPLAALKEGRSGKVEVGALVTEKGNVSHAYVAKSDAAKDLQLAAVDSVYKWRFPVIKEDGKAIKYVFVVPVTYAFESTSAPSAPKAPTPKLEEVIFDAKYLREVLRPKTIVSPIDFVSEVPPEVTQAIKEAKLSEVTELFSLPAGATPLKRDKMVAPTYPEDKRWRKVGGSAAFLLYVGADGKVLGLYCYQATDRVFAIAAAQAIIRWKFKPAKVGDTVVPVLTSQLLTFDAR